VKWRRCELPDFAVKIVVTVVTLVMVVSVISKEKRPPEWEPFCYSLLIDLFINCHLLRTSALLSCYLWHQTI
jgi:hypothetical protein